MLHLGIDDVNERLKKVNEQIAQDYKDDDISLEHDGSMQQRVFAEFAEARMARLPHEYLWWTSYEWYKGNTSVHLDLSTPGAPEVFRIKQRGRRSRSSRPINFTGHAIDLLTSKQMKTHPIFDAVPSSGDQEDIERARVARDFLRFQWRKQKLSSRRRQAFLDRNICGNSFAIVYYDRLSPPYRGSGEECEECRGSGMKDRQAFFLNGKEVSAEDIAMEMPDISVEELRGLRRYIPYECGNCKGEGKVVDGEEPMGDTRVDFFRPWQAYPHPHATCIEDAEYFMRAYPASHEVIAARYDIPFEEIRSTSMLATGESEFARRARAANASYANDRSTYIIEKFMPPLPGEMQPRLTVVAGDKVVVPGPKHSEEEQRQGWVKMKERTGRIPIYHFRLRPSPEQFFALGKVPEMIAANETVNRGRANLHKNLMRMGNPKWAVMTNTVKPDAITDEVAEVIEYDLEAPKQISPPPLPEWIFRTLEREEDTIYNIAGLSDLERGRVPPNVEAAQAFEIIIEQSETTHGPVVLEDQENWEAIGHNILQTSIAYYEDDEERIVRVVGAGGRYEASALKGADLDDSVDVTVRTSSVMEVSKALKRLAVTEAVAAGILPPEEAREHLEFPPSPGEYGEERRMQEAIAQMESKQLYKNPQMKHEVSVIDDHAIHARIHRMEALKARQAGDLDAAEALGKASMAHMAQVQQAQAPAGQPGGGAPGQESVESKLPGAVPFGDQQTPPGSTPGQPVEMGGMPVP